jgi:DNA-directed RNA polymerase specialized sigma24 family protein
MSVMSELAYDIEQMYIEGYSPKTIAALLECPIEIVYDWIQSNSLSADEASYDPYDTVNS